MISAHQMESGGGFSAGGSNLSSRQDEGRFWAYRAQAYDKGNAVIRAKNRVRRGVTQLA